MHIVFRIFLLIFCTSIAYCSYPEESAIRVHIRVENQFGHLIEGRVAASLRDGTDAEVATLTGVGNIFAASGTRPGPHEVPFETLKNVDSVVIRTAARCEPERASFWLEKRYVGLELPTHPKENLGSRAYWLYEFNQTVKLNCTGVS